MATMESVLAVYPATRKTSVVSKDVRRDFSNGGYEQVVTTTETTTCEIFAYLSCGHTRIKQKDEVFKSVKRLSCHICDHVKFTRHRNDNQEMIDFADQRSKENLDLVALHRSEGHLLEK